MSTRLINPNNPYVRSFRRFTTFFSVPLKRGSARIDTRNAPQYIGYSSTRAMLNYNEDRYSVGFLELSSQSKSDLPSSTPQDNRVPIFNASVFDGHGGQDSAEYLKTHLQQNLENTDPNSLLEPLSAEFRAKFGHYWNSPEIWTLKNSAFANKLKLAYLNTDMQLLNTKTNSGSTCTSVYISPTTSNPKGLFWEPESSVDLITAQIGDSSVIICDVHGTPCRLNKTHQLNNLAERKRLQEYKDCFQQTVNGKERFMQYLNTRSFGDLQAKPFGLSAEPEISEYKIRAGLGKRGTEEAFIVLMSDGITDSISDQEVADLVIAQAVNAKGSAQTGADDVISYALDVGAFDNSTAIVVRLGGWGKWQWTDKSSELRKTRLQTARIET